MKIKSKFIILLSGIMFIPAIITFLLFFTQILSFSKVSPLLEYFGERIWTNKILPELLMENNIDLVRSKIPDYINMVIITENNLIVFSSISGLNENSEMDLSSILTVLKSKTTILNLQINSIKTNSRIYYAILENREIKNLGFLKHNIFIPGVYTGLSILIFAVVMIVIILGSIQKSIFLLDMAAKRIKAGDYDFSIPTKVDDEINILMHSFEAMRIALKEEKERRARFIMGVSHDLKTPLALIEGYIEAIEDGYADSKENLQKYTSIIKDKAKLLESRITDLIDFAKMETGELKVKQEEINLYDYLSSLLKTFKEDALLLNRGFDFQLIGIEDCYVQFDRRLIARVIENIIVNSFQYTNAGGKITVIASKTNRSVTLQLSDNGIGIKKDEAGKIFEPLYRGSSSRNEPGFGLGLSIAKTILNSHGWDIALSPDNPQSEGACFVITIPLEKIINR